jgi:tripartite-type tricarboxylate transporter receptor subunit TctC
LIASRLRRIAAKRSKSRLVTCFCCAVSSGPVFSDNSADAYPDRPVRWVVPFAPAGPSDLMSRALAEKLSQRLGQQFRGDNRAGASGNIGAEVVSKSTTDVEQFSALIKSEIVKWRKVVHDAGAKVD